MSRSEEFTPTLASPPSPVAGNLHGMQSALAEMARLGSDVLALPFDMVREQYARSVRAGLVERSMLASAKFGQWISALERLTLGAMARRY